MGRESRRSAAGNPGIRWRLLAGAVALAVVGVSTALGAIKLRDYVITSPQFLFSRDRRDALSIEGLHYTSRAKVGRIFAPDFDHSVFSIPLAERRRRLLAVDWVEDAAVSRLWPNRVLVHIRERQPVAFVFLRSSILLIDGEGVLLDPPAAPGTAQFTFPVLHGVREEETETQRRVHVRAMLRLEREMGALAKDISEVNAADPDDLRIVVRVESQPAELMMGDTNFASRYRNFLNHYSEIRKTSPGAKTFDLRLDDRIAVRGTTGPWQ